MKLLEAVGKHTSIDYRRVATQPLKSLISTVSTTSLLYVNHFRPVGKSYLRGDGLAHPYSVLSRGYLLLRMPLQLYLHVTLPHVPFFLHSRPASSAISSKENHPGPAFWHMALSLQPSHALHTRHRHGTVKSRHDPENFVPGPRKPFLIWSTPNPTLWEAGRPGAFHPSYSTTALL